ncbi:anti-sigma regulatory factor (Ser/Thr protein kinase) [Filimonas zeae]|uniref:TorS-related protein n=1 Tax=Filimonas zeae TaxID=1737353 RepID=A0A917IZU2_9BACT|nr:ATP-binding SpoIIE family protein phosphatase [Filimonas zeae]MDR6341730.1 anti-sigma regulatory factor (Ser/Thr protein kinase) [Filimonas zeae]GGH74426.1 TorS-related protein [Filimonas zeae]
MAKPHHIAFDVTDRSYLALIKKDIHSLALQVDFTATKVAEIDIVVAELASNLLKYGKEGQLLVKSVSEHNYSGIELISIDKGPGMSDVSRMLEDGVSTGNTLGQGLGAIKRLSDVFQVYTVKGWGTVVLSRIFNKPPAPHKRMLAEVRSIVVPKPGETFCGDAMCCKYTPHSVSILLGDGLGHGPEAAKVATAAVNAFQECTESSPAEVIRYIHQAVRKTRGLVGTVATFNFTSRSWLVCGVGNISCRIGSSTDQFKNNLSYNGIIGMNIPSTINDQEIAWVPGQQILLYSDGLKSRLELYRNPAIYKHDASILAAALYKDYARQTDDMSVVVGKINLT